MTAASARPARTKADSATCQVHALAVSSAAAQHAPTPGLIRMSLRAVSRAGRLAGWFGEHGRLPG